MTCVCIKREKIRTHICVHACIETVKEAAVSGTLRVGGCWLWGQCWGTDILLYVYMCI